MARRGRGQRGSQNQLIANDPLRSLLSPLAPSSPVFELDRSLLEDVSDDRVWHPDPDRGAVTIGGNWARVVVHPRPFVARTKPVYAWKGLPVGLQPPVGLKYESPLNVVKCVRRKIRRSVIFALKRNKKGSGAARRRKSDGVKC